MDTKNLLKIAKATTAVFAAAYISTMLEKVMVEKSVEAVETAAEALTKLKK